MLRLGRVFGLVGFVYLLAGLRHGWRVVGHVSLRLGVVQCLMWQECGLQAAVLQLSTQELFNAFNRR